MQLRVAALSTQAIEERKKAFQDTNGAEWGRDAGDECQFDALSGYVMRMSRFTRSLSISPHCIDVAREFIARNCDSIGFTQGDASSLRFTTDNGGQTAMAQANIPMNGYESFPSLSKDIRLVVGVTGDSGPWRLFSRSPPYPAIGMNVVPIVSDSDPQLKAALLGRELEYNDAAGEIQTVGVIKESMIGAPKLDVDVERYRHTEHGDAACFTLVYRFDIVSGNLHWGGVVDADTALLLHLNPKFMT